MKILQMSTKKVLWEGKSLIGANLCEADLAWAYLREADLSGADLSGADLCEANLREADLHGADLSGANLSGADLSGADLREVNLCEAYLSGTNLSGAKLQRANLREANLYGAYLYGTILYGTILPNFQIPQKGELVVWKKLQDNVIAKLLVPSGAKRTASLVGRKCRAEYVKVLEIIGGEKEGYSLFNTSFKYCVGKKVVPNKYDDDIRVECSSGIHFFLTREEAEKY